MRKRWKRMKSRKAQIKMNLSLAQIKQQKHYSLQNIAIRQNHQTLKEKVYFNCNSIRRQYLRL